MISLLKKLRRSLLGRLRFLRLYILNRQLVVGRNFFCASGCRISPGRKINIGDDFYMGFGCHLAADICIASDVMFASNVSVVGGDHKIDFIDVPIRDSGRDVLKMTTFEEGCWVGHGAIILHGVTVGSGSVVAAGSVVTKNVEPNSIVGGNPAKLIRYRAFENKSKQL